MTIFVHEYKGFGGCQSKCKVYYLKKDGLHLFCFEDMNKGTSVTNMSEYLATQMIEKFSLNRDVDECRFFESYNDLGNEEDRTFDEITYTWEGNVADNPDWKPSEERDMFGF
ncbi:MAG: hypothetical protein WC333_00450 [Dehalococcoidia bacterium]|jgi:hypothetical protein